MKLKGIKTGKKRLHKWATTCYSVTRFSPFGGITFRVIMLRVERVTGAWHCDPCCTRWQRIPAIIIAEWKPRAKWREREGKGEKELRFARDPEIALGPYPF